MGGFWNFLANSISPVGDVRSYPSSKPFYEKKKRPKLPNPDDCQSAPQDSSKTIPNYLQKIASLKVERTFTFPGGETAVFFCCWKVVEKQYLEMGLMKGDLVGRQVLKFTSCLK